MTVTKRYHNRQHSSVILTLARVITVRRPATSACKLRSLSVRPSAVVSWGEGAPAFRLAVAIACRRTPHRGGGSTAGDGRGERMGHSMTAVLALLPLFLVRGGLVPRSWGGCS